MKIHTINAYAVNLNYDIQPFPLIPRSRFSLSLQVRPSMNPKWQEESFLLPEKSRNRTALPSALPLQLADVTGKRGEKKDRKKERKNEGAYHNREAVKCARDTRFHSRQNFLSAVVFLLYSFVSPDGFVLFNRLLLLFHWLCKSIWWSRPYTIRLFI